MNSIGIFTIPFFTFSVVTFNFMSPCAVKVPSKGTRVSYCINIRLRTNVRAMWCDATKNLLLEKYEKFSISLASSSLISLSFSSILKLYFYFALYAISKYILLEVLCRWNLNISLEKREREMQVIFLFMCSYPL